METQPKILSFYQMVLKKENRILFSANDILAYTEREAKLKAIEQFLAKNSLRWEVESAIPIQMDDRILEKTPTLSEDERNLLDKL